MKNNRLYAIYTNFYDVTQDPKIVSIWSTKDDAVKEAKKLTHYNVIIVEEIAINTESIDIDGEYEVIKQ